MKKVLIVGGAGYVGSYLTGFLLRAGYKVRVLDNFIYNNNYSIHSFLSDSNFQILYGDMNNDKISKSALKDIDDVVLLAGLVGDPITKKFPEIANKINETAIKNFINICNHYPIQKLIFISTCSNYGLIKEGEVADENFELRPLSLYSKSKVKIEKYILNLKGKLNYHPTILRFATAFGLSPRMRFDLTISEFVRELFQNKELLVYDSNTWRPYCHVKDFARLISIVLNSDIDQTSFEIFNAGGDQNNYTKKDIIELILKKIPNGKVNYQEKGSDPRNYKVNFNKVLNTLNFQPIYDVNYGINELHTALENNIYINPHNLQYGNFEVHY